MKALLLAAGKGTRLKHLTADRPKPMVPIQGRPVLEHVVLSLRSAGIERFILVTGYLGNVIEEHFGDGSGFGIEVRYVHQAEQRGTGHAVHIAREAVGDEPFCMTFGDKLMGLQDYSAFVEDYRKCPCDALLALDPVDDPHQGAAVYVDGKWNVKRIVEKPPQGTSRTNWNNAGLFVFDPIVFTYTEKLPESPRGEYELPDAVTAMIADGRSVRAFPLRQPVGHLTKPEDVEQVSRIADCGSRTAD